MMRRHQKTAVLDLDIACDPFFAGIAPYPSLVNDNEWVKALTALMQQLGTRAGLRHIQRAILAHRQEVDLPSWVLPPTWKRDALLSVEQSGAEAFLRGLLADLRRDIGEPALALPAKHDAVDPEEFVRVLTRLGQDAQGDVSLVDNPRFVAESIVRYYGRLSFKVLSMIDRIHVFWHLNRLVHQDQLDSDPRIYSKIAYVAAVAPLDDEGNVKFDDLMQSINQD